MDDKLANDLITKYEQGLEKFGIEIVDVKYRAKGTKLWIKANGETKEYSASVGGGTVLGSHVSVLRQAYWEESDRLKFKHLSDKQNELISAVDP